MRGALPAALFAAAVLTLPFLALPPATLEPVRADAAGITPEALDFAVGTTTSHFVWSTTYIGNLGIRMEFDFPGIVTCTFIAKVAGQVGGSPLFYYFGHDAVGRTWTAWQQPFPSSVHALDASIVTVMAGGMWHAQSTHGVTFTSDDSWVFAGFGLRGWNNPTTAGKSVIFDLTCPAAFTVTEIEGGKEVLGFVVERMRGGVGASTAQGLASSVNVADSAGRAITLPHGLARFRSEDNVAGGLLQLAAPDGTQTRLLLGDDDFFHDAGAGTYRFNMHARASVGTQQGVGIILGLTSVASLDAATAL